MLLDEVHLNFIREQIKGAHVLLIQEQGGEDEDNFKLLEKAIDRLDQTVTFIDEILNDEKLSSDRIMRTFAYVAVENYANVCKKLKEEGSSIYDSPKWKLAEGTVVAVGEKILERKSSEEK